MGLYLSSRHGLPLVQTSARMGQGIEDSFSLVIGMLRRMKEVKTEQKERGTKQQCCSIC